LALLLWAQRAFDARAWPTWRRLEGNLARDAAWMRGTLERRVAIIGAFLDAIEGEWYAQHDESARRLLEQARVQLSLHARDTRESLREWGEEARALAALVPLQPLSPSRLRVRRVRGIALAWRACHWLGATSRERFLLRVAVLRWSLASLSRWWSTVPLPRRSLLRWTEARALRHDLGALGAACADSYEALLVSRRAQPKRQDARRVPRAAH
jgi:hypothetical protein